MTSLANSEVFFFISSIGFIILGILIVIFLILSIQVVFSFRRILGKIETSMDKIGGATMDLIEEVRDHTFFKYFFTRTRSVGRNDTKIN